MPYRRKDSAIWWVSYTDASGKRVRRPTGSTDRKEAELLAAKWRLEGHQERQWGQRPPRTFSELMVQYLKATSQKRSAEKDRMRTKHLREIFGTFTINELTSAHVRRYIDHRLGKAISPSTINRELALLSAAINYANREWDWDLPNPVKGRKLREPEGRVRWITRDEAAALIEAAQSEPRARHLPAFIQLGLNTGCRSGELLGLEWNRVDLHANLIHLEAQHTKTAKRRSVPLNLAACNAIIAQAQRRTERCPDTPWVFFHPSGTRIQCVKKGFASACRNAGITNFLIHDLRHTCAAWLVSAGVPLTEVRDLLGHSTVKMTERYAHLAPENVRAAVAVLDQHWSRSGHGQPNLVQNA
jgi:integrase